MKDLYLYSDMYFDEGTDDGGSGGDDGAKDTGKDTSRKPDTKPAGQKTDTNQDDDDKDDDRKKAKYSDDDLDRIISRKIAKLQKQHAADVDKAAKYAQMTAQERAEAERDDLKKELAELKRANAVAEMEKTARGVLSEAGVSVPDEIVSGLIRDDADETDKAVKAFIKAYKAAVQEGVKNALTHGKPKDGGSASATTKEEIMKIKDPVARQKAISQHADLFNNYRGHR